MGGLMEVIFSEGELFMVGEGDVFEAILVLAEVDVPHWAEAAIGLFDPDGVAE